MNAHETTQRDQPRQKPDRPAHGMIPAGAHRLVAAEATKLVSVRSTWGLLIGAAGFAAASTAGILASGSRDGMDFGSTQAIRLGMHASGAGATLVLVLGIVVAAGEYRHQTIIDTYLTTPRRGRVLLAKLLATSLAGLLFGLAIVVSNLAVAIPWFAAKDHPLRLDDVNVWATLTGSVLWAAAYAAIGVALGTFLRGLIPALIAGLTWILVLEQIALSLAPGAGKWLPAASAAALGRAPRDGLLPQWGGGLMLAAYTVLIATAAVLTTMRRDVT